MKLKIYEVENENDKNYLALEHETEVNFNDTHMATPECVINLMKSVFKADKKSDENVWLLALDAKMKIIGAFHIAKGSVNNAYFSARSIFCPLLLCNATGFIMVHNHLSDDATPSADDSQITDRLMEAAELIGFKMYEHIIISKTGYYSFAESMSNDKIKVV